MLGRDRRCASFLLAPLLLLLLGCGGHDLPPSAPLEGLEGGDALARELRPGRGPFVSAHRGGPSGGYPENALTTLERTHALGVRLLEVDVRAAGDGTLVLLHDESLDRTTTGSGPLRATSGGQLRSLRLRDREGRLTDATIPTLDRALRWACEAGAVLTLDVKERVPYSAVVQAIRSRRAEPCAGIITYDLPGLREVHRLAPDLLLTVRAQNAQEMEALVRSGVELNHIMVFAGIVARPEEVPVELLSRLHERRVPVILGTFPLDADAYDEEPYRRLFEKGVDVIATDRPDLAQRAASR